MYITQGDLFWGMSKTFVKDAMALTTKISCEDGHILFTEGDPADHFFILLKGRVMLSLGQTGPTVYIARHPGEIIGWSSLIGRDNYSASAKCLEPSQLIKADSRGFLECLERDPGNEAILYKRLAEMMSERLLAVYPSVS